MSDTINISALITRSVLIQGAKAQYDAAAAEETSIDQQIKVLHDQQILATRKKLDAEIQVKNASAITEADLPIDTYRKVSLIEQEGFPERTRVKGRAFDFLFSNQDATYAAVINVMDAEGGPDRMHNYAGVVNAYIRNAHAAAMIAEPTWDAFKAFVLFIGKEQALNL